MYLNLPARAWVNPIDGSRHPLGVCLGWTYRTRREGKGPMAETSFAESVGRRREIEITTIGRRSGREISLPVWFVRRNETVLLLPVYGSDTSWYKNVLKDPTIKIVLGGPSAPRRRCRSPTHRPSARWSTPSGTSTDPSSRTTRRPTSPSRSRRHDVLTGNRDDGPGVHARHGCHLERS